ncbi:facilitated trehalose transporter Tret1-like [Penaeus japonicus]|uniref:facilitated trehalose transporter Tret1-like n=1 Tax=Penaeus japonicus TaxID=27405 RepID=UPI001C70F7EF|nr:facilitated trehalose transporter Tret1-like [Penaeus japonicus]
MSNKAVLYGEEELLRKETPGEWRGRISKQALMVFAIGLGFVVLGMAAGYPNAAVADLRQDNSTLFGSSFDLEPWQEDMMGSILSAGALVGTWLGGWALRTAGRRRSMLSLVMPSTISWGLVALAVRPWMLLAGRFFSGVFSGMMSIVGNVYAVELPDTSVRGFLAMLPNVMVSVGLLASVSLGLCLRWFEIPVVAMALFFVCFTSMLFVPESPTFLAVSGRESEARRVLRRLRGPCADVEEEMRLLKAYNQDKTDQPIVRVLLQRDVLRALLVIQALFFIQNFCGFSAFMINTTRIFQDAGSSLDEELSSILVFLVQMAGTVSASLLLDRAGRRLSLIASMAVMTLCLYAMGTYVYFAEREGPGEHLENSWGWVPLACLMVYMFSASFGVATVPFILNAEYFPTKIRAQAASIGLTGANMYGILALQLFTPMQTALTTPGLYWFYGGVSIAGVLFCYAFIRETMKIAVG